MERITFDQFGPITNLDAAHIIDDNGRIVAVVAEPEARDICTDGNTMRAGDGWNEAAFRAAVEAEVASWEARDSGETLVVQYDPGRNHASEVEVELRG